MPNIALLHHILGDYSDKIKSLPSAPQPELSQMINDLSQVAYHHNDGKNTIQAIDLWEAALINPNLNIDNLKKLFPLVFRIEQYSVRQNNPLIPDSCLRSDQICKNLTEINVSDEIWVSLFKALLEEPKPFVKESKFLNKRTKDLIKCLTTKNLPELKLFLNNHKEAKIKNISTEILLSCLNPAYRSFRLDPLYVFNVTKADIRTEINRRKMPTPKAWKNYTTQNFLPFFKQLSSTIQKAKLERRDFFKILKNRLWNHQQLIDENEKYLNLLTQMEDTIKEQKELIQIKIKNLKADSTRKTD